MDEGRGVLHPPSRGVAGRSACLVGAARRRRQDMDFLAQWIRAPSRSANRRGRAADPLGAFLGETRLARKAPGRLCPTSPEPADVRRRHPARSGRLRPSLARWFRAACARCRSSSPLESFSLLELRFTDPDRKDARGSVRSPAPDCVQASERSLLVYRFTNTIPFADSVLLGSKVFVPSVAARM